MGPVARYLDEDTWYGCQHYGTCSTGSTGSTIISQVVLVLVVGRTVPEAYAMDEVRHRSRRHALA
eukprot:551353-Rhodomonas_salina.2